MVDGDTPLTPDKKPPPLRWKEGSSRKKKRSCLEAAKKPEKKSGVASRPEKFCPTRCKKERGGLKKIKTLPTSLPSRREKESRIEYRRPVTGRERLIETHSA